MYKKLGKGNELLASYRKDKSDAAAKKVVRIRENRAAKVLSKNNEFDPKLKIGTII